MATVRRRERGAAAVEGGIVTVAILAPILLGVLGLGYFLWRDQSVSLYPPRSLSSAAYGYCTEAELVDRVKSTAAAALWDANSSTLGSLGFRTVDDVKNYLFVNVVPDTVDGVPTVGANVDVSLNLNPDPTHAPQGFHPIDDVMTAVDHVLSGLNRIPVAYDTTARLDDVEVSTAGGSCNGPTL